MAPLIILKLTSVLKKKLPTAAGAPLVKFNVKGSGLLLDKSWDPPAAPMNRPPVAAAS
jgi:hypothetical protein